VMIPADACWSAESAATKSPPSPSPPASSFRRLISLMTFNASLGSARPLPSTSYQGASAGEPTATPALVAIEVVDQQQHIDRRYEPVAVDVPANVRILQMVGTDRRSESHRNGLQTVRPATIHGSIAEDIGCCDPRRACM